MTDREYSYEGYWFDQFNPPERITPAWIEQAMAIFEERWSDPETQHCYEDALWQLVLERRSSTQRAHKSTPICHEYLMNSASSRSGALASSVEVVAI